jgi:hypothetical protein
MIVVIGIITASFDNIVFGFSQKLPAFVLGPPAVESFFVLPWSVEPKHKIVVIGIIMPRYNNGVCGTAGTWLYPAGNSGGYNDDALTVTWFSAVRKCLPFLKLNSSVEYHTKDVN